LKDEDRACLETNLTAVAIWGIQDPLREGIAKSIELCNTAGISVIMCTGDNLDTAKAISRNAGIVSEAEINDKEFADYTCTTGKEFRMKVGEDLLIEKDAKGKITSESVRNMNEFKKFAKHLKVLARSSPLDKRILVTGMQQCDGVVAVTGDGTNDAPALTKADVGFSMGITGTDIAKAASDIILLDDNFTSIIVALKYGRNVYDSVRKFLQF
jgi:Ca2+ transporting ATPase